MRGGRLISLGEKDVSRFWVDVDNSGEEGECWEWMAAVTSSGYGNFCINQSWFTAHRVSFFLSTGVQPMGLRVCHKCDNPICCNPVHLFLGTALDNGADMVSKGRSARGERHGSAVLTVKEVKEIRVRRANGEKLQALADEYHVTFKTIHKVANRLRWKHIL